MSQQTLNLLKSMKLTGMATALEEQLGQPTPSEKSRFC